MSNNQNPYDAQYNEWNQMIVPGTGGITASYAEQKAAGIHPGESAYLAQVKLGVHRANEIAKSYANLNKTASVVAAKPMQYRGPTGTSRAAGYPLAGSPMRASLPTREARPVVGPLLRRAMSMLGSVLRNFSGIIFFVLMVVLASHPGSSHILRHYIGVVPVLVISLGAVIANVLWLLFRLARPKGRGLKKVGVVTSAVGSKIDKAVSR